MGKEKESESLLYRLYRQCANYLNNEEKEPEGPLVFPELFEKNEGNPAFSDTLKGEFQPGISSLSEDRKHLEPLLELKAALKGDTKLGEWDMEALEAQTFEIVRDHPLYPEFCKEAESFAKELSGFAADYMRTLTALEAAGNELLQEGQPNESQERLGQKAPLEQRNAKELVWKPFPASVRIYCSHDAMFALAFLFPAAWGGKPADSDLIAAAIGGAGITYGIVAEAFAMLASGQHDMQLVLIAKGTAPVDGRDGSIIEKYPRIEEITISQDENGKADFKNLNRVKSVKENQVICEIIPPTEGLSGTDVFGRLIGQRAGVMPPVPSGKNTRLSEDGLKIVAAASGRLLFKNGVFEVAELLVIQSDVDYSVGNLDFPGDIVIMGGVQTGFTVKASGSITIHGTVEGAFIISGGDVILKKGMNGSYEGEIHAEGQVKANFLENCKVYANGSVYSNSIISCHTYSGESVNAEGTIGTIVGGTVMALYTVTARTIGNKNLKETVITLGTAPRLLTERKETLEEQKEVLITLEKLDKNLDYLHRNIGTIPTEKLEVLSQLEEQQRMYRERKDKLAAKLEKLDSYRMNFSQCSLKSNTVFPATRVVFGPYFRVFESVALRCNVFLSEDEIVVGTLA